MRHDWFIPTLPTLPHGGLCVIGEVDGQITHLEASERVSEEGSSPEGLSGLHVWTKLDLARGQQRDNGNGQVATDPRRCSLEEGTSTGETARREPLPTLRFD